MEIDAIQKSLESIVKGNAALDSKLELLSNNVVTGYQELRQELVKLSDQQSNLSERQKQLEKIVLGSNPPPPDGTEALSESATKALREASSANLENDALRAQIIVLERQVSSLNNKVDAQSKHMGIGITNFLEFLRSTEGKKFVVSVSTAILALASVVGMALKK